MRVRRSAGVALDGLLAFFFAKWRLKWPHLNFLPKRPNF